MSFDDTIKAMNDIGNKFQTDFYEFHSELLEFKLSDSIGREAKKLGLKLGLIKGEMLTSLGKKFLDFIHEMDL